MNGRRLLVASLGVALVASSAFGAGLKKTVAVSRFENKTSW